MSLTFKYSTSIPLKWVDEHLRELIFPDITKKVNLIKKNFKGVLAKSGDQAVGLILGLPDQTGQYFRVVSLKVKPEFQNKKIAVGLLLALEESLVKEGFVSIDLQYRSHWPTVPILKRLIKRLSWNDPVLGLTICQSIAQHALPVFHTNYQLPEGYEFTPWGKVSDWEKQQMKTQQAEKAWFPEDVSPFQLEHMIESNVSVALRYQGKIVGWLIQVKITEETLEYTSLFVHPDHRSFKVAHLLMGEGIRRQIDQGRFKKLLFTVKASNNTMKRFIERNKTVRDLVITDVYETQKSLL